MREEYSLYVNKNAEKKRPLFTGSLLESKVIFLFFSFVAVYAFLGQI